MSEVAIRGAQADDIPQRLTLVRQYWAFEQIAGLEPQRIGPLLLRLMAQPHLGRIFGGAVGATAGRLPGGGAGVESGAPGADGGGERAVRAPRGARPEAWGASCLRGAEEALAQAGCVRLQLQLAMRRPGPSTSSAAGLPARATSCSTRPCREGADGPCRGSAPRSAAVAGTGPVSVRTACRRPDHFALATALDALRCTRLTTRMPSRATWIRCPCERLTVPARICRGVRSRW